MRMSAALCAACVISLAALAGLTLGQEQAEGKAKLVNNGECLAALEIWGEWKPNKEVTTRIGGNADDTATCVFEKFDVKDEETPKLLLSEADKLLAQMRSKGRKNEVDAVERAITEIYAMGKYTRVEGDQKVEQKFLLVNFMGNPHLFILRNANGRLDWETQNLAFARDPKGNGDLLFLGGDHKNERFTCLARGEN